LFEITKPILERAEALADSGATLPDVLRVLRDLSLDDFGLLFLGLPDVEYPRLSALLPPMTAAEVQVQWTGASGIQLLTQTASFVRQLENNLARYKGRPLAGSRILDFGCGYGRIMRLLYYYSDPANLWGLDAWQRSLDLCAASRLPGQFALSDPVPTHLPVGGQTFDLMFAFSIFTHLAPAAARACLKAMREHIAPDGLLVATVRPVEFWDYMDSVRATSTARELRAEHARSGFAYVPHKGPEGDTYGDASVDPAGLAIEGWSLLGYDRSLVDPYQVSVVLAPEN
jgi:SAM-dependent methyltransferase